MSYPDFLDVRSQNHVLAAMAAFRERHEIVFTGRGEPERLHGTICSSNLFGVLGVDPALGRAFRSEEDQPGKGSVVILSNDFWRSHFHSDESVLGRSMVLDGGSYEIVGVMPPAFNFPISAEPTAIWMTVAADGEMTKGRGVAIYDVISRLKPGVSEAQATAELNTIFAGIAAQYPRNHTDGWRLQSVFTWLIL